MLFSKLFSLCSLDTQRLFVIGTFISLAFSLTSAQDEDGCWFREDPNSAADDVVLRLLVTTGSLLACASRHWWVSYQHQRKPVDFAAIICDLTSVTTSTALTTSTTITATTSSTITTSTSTTNTMVETQTPHVRTIIRHHDAHRANHSAPALAWSDSLAGTAQSIAETCIFQHNTTADSGDYGQNIVAGVPENQMGIVVTDTFYNP
ncbi:hypothetical protein MCOR06_009152 [Pyricularia oryzae]|nr:hypothetical protein MCOR20_005016 [Pyricularia oryzae]KAI6581250.1 hypothetical protein MCOR06_009152 [Pyricularia oryzae]